MKGIVLAGGSGTRLHPVTAPISKQLLPVYDKPLVYYPLSVLMLAGIREILVITTPRDVEAFRALLGDGSRWGLSLEYAVQDQPRGLADAFRVGREFVGSDSVSLVLGDNLFFAYGLSERLRAAAAREHGATVFAHPVSDPQRYGIVTFRSDGTVVDLEEKPSQPRSNFAVVGLYFYDNDVVDLAAELAPSARGELEITDLNRAYLERGDLRVELLGRGAAWFDAGTTESLLEAANFVRLVERQQGLLIASPEEIAWRLGYVDDAAFEQLAMELAKSEYGAALLQVLRRRQAGVEPDDFLRAQRTAAEGSNREPLAAGWRW